MMNMTESPSRVISGACSSTGGWIMFGKSLASPGKEIAAPGMATPSPSGSPSSSPFVKPSPSESLEARIAVQNERPCRTNASSTSNPKSFLGPPPDGLM